MAETKFNHGGYAFPHGGTNTSGMKLWEYFAAAALNGFCANGEIFNSMADDKIEDDNVNCVARLTRFAADQADAMIAERNKRIGKVITNLTHQDLICCPYCKLDSVCYLGSVPPSLQDGWYMPSGLSPLGFFFGAWWIDESS